MTLTLELPERISAEVSVEASAEGLTREEWAKRLIERHLTDHATPIVELSAADRNRLNLRRAELIKRQHGPGLSEAEDAELSALQARWDTYLSLVAPLPWEALERLEATVGIDHSGKRSV